MASKLAQLGTVITETVTAQQNSRAPSGKPTVVATDDMLPIIVKALTLCYRKGGKWIGRDKLRASTLKNCREAVKPSRLPAGLLAQLDFMTEWSMGDISRGGMN